MIKGSCYRMRYEMKVSNSSGAKKLTGWYTPKAIVLPKKAMCILMDVRKENRKNWCYLLFERCGLVQVPYGEAKYWLMRA